MKTRSISKLAGPISILVVAGCYAGNSGVLGDGGTGGTGTTSGHGGQTSAQTVTAVADTGAAQFMSGATTGTSGSPCTATAEEDQDQDGWTMTQGDCNDCDKNVNPGAIEVVITTPDMNGNIPTPVDEDCDGTIDNPPPTTCDDNIGIDGIPGLDGARAIELCKDSTGPKDWGLVYAAYVRANGAAAQPTLQTGVLDGFGPNVAPRKGTRLLGLSSGHARVPGQVGACGSNYCTTVGPGTAPPNFPQDVSGCGGATNINDDIGLQVELRAPSNATGYKFDFDFYSFEYPEYVCTDYNDQFIALVQPAPQGSINGNITFDSMNNPVSVNIAFFNVCTGCALGTNELMGTGFDIWNDAGATSWLETQAPVNGLQDITIRFAIWDTGDSNFDSTTLIDNFRWIANGGTVVVGTTPVPS